MSERDNQISERLKVLLPRLSDQDKRVLMAYGEGMADKAARSIMTHDSAPEPKTRTYRKPPGEAAERMWK